MLNRTLSLATMAIISNATPRAVEAGMCDAGDQKCIDAEADIMAVWDFNESSFKEGVEGIKDFYLTNQGVEPFLKMDGYGCDTEEGWYELTTGDGAIWDRD